MSQTNIETRSTPLVNNGDSLPDLADVPVGAEPTVQGTELPSLSVDSTSLDSVEAGWPSDKPLPDLRIGAETEPTTGDRLEVAQSEMAGRVTSVVLEQARQEEINRAISEALRPIHEAEENLDRVCRQPFGADQAIGVVLEPRLRVPQGENAEPVTAVGGAELMLQFGAMSSEGQQHLMQPLVDRLKLPDEVAQALIQMATRVRDITDAARRGAPAHEVQNQIRQAIGGMHVYKPPYDMPAQQSELTGAWVSAYATGVAIGQQLHDRHDQAGTLDTRLEAILRREYAEA